MPPTLTPWTPALVASNTSPTYYPSTADPLDPLMPLRGYIEDRFSPLIGLSKTLLVFVNRLGGIPHAMGGQSWARQYELYFVRGRPGDAALFYLTVIDRKRGRRVTFPLTAFGTLTPDSTLQDALVVLAATYLAGRALLGLPPVPV